MGNGGRDVYGTIYRFEWRCDAVRAVRDRAVAASIAAAAEILAGQVRAGQRSAGIDDAIEDVARRLN